MNFLLDTNHWSFVQRGHPAVVERLARTPGDSAVFMSAVTQGELLVGLRLIPPGRRRAQLERLYEQGIHQTSAILPVDSAIAEHYASIVATLRAKGRPIETNDI